MGCSRKGYNEKVAKLCPFSPSRPLSEFLGGASGLVVGLPPAGRAWAGAGTSCLFAVGGRAVLFSLRGKLALHPI